MTLVVLSRPLAVVLDRRTLGGGIVQEVIQLGFRIHVLIAATGWAGLLTRGDHE